MWDVIAVIAVILLIKYFFGGAAGGSSSGEAPEASATMEILKSATVQKRDKTSKKFSELLGDCDAVAIYFSAHWCPPCRMFTPVLADAYNQMKKAGRKLEVVFVSSDRSEDAMFSYMEEAHGDWWTVKYDDDARGKLGSHFQVRGIPALIVLKKDGTVISMDGRSDVQGMGAGAWDSWVAPN